MLHDYELKVTTSTTTIDLANGIIINNSNKTSKLIVVFLLKLKTSKDKLLILYDSTNRCQLDICEQVKERHYMSYSIFNNK